MTTTSPDLYRDEFTTGDLAEAREFLDRTCGGRLLTASVPAGRAVLTVSRTDTGEFLVSDVTLPADLTFAVDPLDQVIISTVTRGPCKSSAVRTSTATGPAMCSSAAPTSAVTPSAPTA